MKRRTASSYFKLSLASLTVLVSCCLCAWRLMKIQIVESENYQEKHSYTQVYTQNINATRGEIVDSDGNPIIENKVGYNVIIEPDTFPEDNKEGNRVILLLTDILRAHHVDFSMTLPITETQPYAFTEDEKAVEKLKDNLQVNVYATAENCMDALMEEYDIDDSYTQEEQRLLAGIRYEMQLRSFSLSNRFTLAEDASIAVVTELKERGVTLPGVDIVEEAIRCVAQGDVVPHEIGTVGPIYAEDYEELKAKGYELDDIVGRNGIERAMDLTLRGSDGIKEIKVVNGEIVSSEITTPVVAGSTVQLTVNSAYQRELQGILEDFIQNFDNFRDAKTQEAGLGEVSCGAIVVLDAKDGGVLGMATAPTYNLNDYKTNYQSFLGNEDAPLVNRVTDGLYRPGSTFKTITATAGLNEGYISGGSTFNCAGTYMFKDHKYHCTGSHGDISVTRALQVSCNIFFYRLSEQLTIDGISEYASKFGLGQPTGLETGERSGHLSNQETFAELGVDWTVGQVLQSAIGQGEWAVTPLQMANVACTIANNGTRYEPHLVDSIWDYNHEVCTEEIQPVVAEQITPKDDMVFQYVENGMIAASQNNFPAKYSLSNLGYDVAIKTGTPQAGGGRVQDSFFIGYAPANDPEIAFAGVIEGGEYAKYMIRSIIQAYEKTVKGNDAVTVGSFGNTTTVSGTTDEFGNTGTVTGTTYTQATAETTSSEA